ncbi:MAG: GxxExxY protein, partial [Verrucomicrobia bacterium]|nr:GxxExxY protein [Verrucomicrobiota bacterium]
DADIGRWGKDRAAVFLPCYLRQSALSAVKGLMEEYAHKELSHDIIGAAMKVLNTLNPGLDEKIYENALVIELRNRGHKVNQQKQFPVFYEGQEVGKLIPDLMVDDAVIADPKVVTAFNDTHIAQMIGYLAITGLQLALLLNFKEAKLQWKRVVRTGPVESPGD